MSLPRVTLYQKLGKGAEGAHHFARIMNQLIYADDKEMGREVITSSDASGDYKGVDLISVEKIPYNNRKQYIGYQFKFFPSPLNADQRKEIKKSLEKAIEKFPEIHQWVLVVPESFNKADSEWFQKLAKEYENPNEIRISGHFVISPPGDKKYVDVSYIGHVGIANMMLKHPDIGEQYYDEIAEKRNGNLVLTKVSVDTENTNWQRISGYNAFSIRPYHDDNKRSNELIFDFQFINNSDFIYHLHQIEVIIENVWTKLKGISLDEILISIGTIEFQLDFTKKINTIDLSKILGGPLIFKPKSSKRFNLHLLKFAKDCPGNMAELKFEFVFNNMRISSDIIGLDFLN
jgi:hypothetical protein